MTEDVVSRTPDPQTLDTGDDVPLEIQAALMVRMFREVVLHRSKGVDEIGIAKMPFRGLEVHAATLNCAAYLLFPKESVPEL